jgi:hypothetical protein
LDIEKQIFFARRWGSSLTVPLLEIMTPAFIPVSSIYRMVINPDRHGNHFTKAASGKAIKRSGARHC